jgi:hypothetical protein
MLEIPNRPSSVNEHSVTEEEPTRSHALFFAVNRRDAHERIVSLLQDPKWLGSIHGQLDLNNALHWQAKWLCYSVSTLREELLAFSTTAIAEFVKQYGAEEAAYKGRVWQWEQVHGPMA